MSDFDELKKEKAKQSQYGYIESAILLNTGAGESDGVTRLGFLEMFQMFRKTSNNNQQQETDCRQCWRSWSDCPEQDPR